MNYTDDQLKLLELERWIAIEGERTDTCTHSILGRICKGCRCWRSTGGTGSKSKPSMQSTHGQTEQSSPQKIECSNSQNAMIGDKLRLEVVNKSKMLIPGSIQRHQDLQDALRRLEDHEQ